MIRFSIIIPSYNCEKWITKTLNSIFSQTFTDYEIIIVDDMSSDNSVNIIQETIKGHDNAKLFINKTKRYSGGTRNVGISEASGEYILFIDCDDWLIDDHVLEDINNKLDNVDVMYLGFEMLQDSRITENRVLEVYEKQDALELIFPAPWLRVAKRELYLKAMFPEGTMYEDKIQNIYLALTANSFSSLGRATHLWNRDNPQATTFNPKWGMYKFEYCGELYRLIKENENGEYVWYLKKELNAYCKSLQKDIMEVMK